MLSETISMTDVNDGPVSNLFATFCNGICSGTLQRWRSGHCHVTITINGGVNVSEKCGKNRPKHAWEMILTFGLVIQHWSLTCRRYSFTFGRFSCYYVADMVSRLAKSHTIVLLQIRFRIWPVLLLLRRKYGFAFGQVSCYCSVTDTASRLAGSHAI